MLTNQLVLSCTTNSSIYCGLIRQPNREGTTTITPVVNDFTRAFEYSTLDTAVMAGIRGNFYSQGNDVDTMFRFIERALPPPFKYVQAEETEDLGRKVDFVCPSGKAMIGMSSAYGEHMRQSFKVQCARIPGHNLVHAGSGLVFKSGSKGTDADWSFGIKGVGENFALECPAGKLMTGVRTQYGRDFKEKDGGWQIMCLTMKKL